MAHTGRLKLLKSSSISYVPYNLETLRPPNSKALQTLKTPETL